MSIVLGNDMLIDSVHTAISITVTMITRILFVTVYFLCVFVRMAVLYLAFHCIAIVLSMR